MADRMEFPKTMKEFIGGCSFKDREEIYTNGAELIPVFRVEQAFEYYEKEIRKKAIDEFAERLKKHEQENWIDHQEYGITWSDIEKIAEQMRGVE